MEKAVNYKKGVFLGLAVYGTLATVNGLTFNHFSLVATLEIMIGMGGYHFHHSRQDLPLGGLEKN